MIRTDIRALADRPSEIADKIQLVGYTKLRKKEKELCRQHLMGVLRYLGPELRKSIAAIHGVPTPRMKRVYVGKAYLIEKHREYIRRRIKLGLPTPGNPDPKKSAKPAGRTRNNRKPVSR